MRRFAAVGWLLFAGGLVAPAWGQWVEARGQGWVQAALYHHTTRRVFDFRGHNEPILFDGRAVTRSLYLTGALGLGRGLDVWGQLPLHRLQFDDALQDRTRLGLGDPRLYLRAGPGLMGIEGLPVAVAVRGGLKVPGGDFPVDAEVIPLGEGQRDWELMVEVGRSLHPLPAYLMAWAGYRWREANPRADEKPGDERFAFAAAGGHAGRLHWKVAVEAWRGVAPRIQGIVVETGRREMVQLLPSLGVRWGPGVVELGVRQPLRGRNLPAGPAFFAGYFTRLVLR